MVDFARYVSARGTASRIVFVYKDYYNLNKILNNTQPHIGSVRENDNTDRPNSWPVRGNFRGADRAGFSRPGAHRSIRNQSQNNPTPSSQQHLN